MSAPSLYSLPTLIQLGCKHCNVVIIMLQIDVVIITVCPLSTTFYARYLSYYVWYKRMCKVLYKNRQNILMLVPF